MSKNVVNGTATDEANKFVFVSSICRVQGDLIQQLFRKAWIIIPIMHHPQGENLQHNKN